MTTRTKLCSGIFVSTGILLLTTSPAWAQNGKQMINGFRALVKTAPAVSTAKPLYYVSPKITHPLQRPDFQMNTVQNQIMRQIVLKTRPNAAIRGYYKPDANVNTQTAAYLQKVEDALKALYPQPKRRFAPITVNSYQELMQIWKKGPSEDFMSARNAVSIVVQRTYGRRTGFYAVAVESAPESGYPLHDILMLDVNNARWISFRKTAADAHEAIIK